MHLLLALFFYNSLFSIPELIFRHRKWTTNEFFPSLLYSHHLAHVVTPQYVLINLFLWLISVFLNLETSTPNLPLNPVFLGDWMSMVFIIPPATLSAYPYIFFCESKFLLEMLSPSMVVILLTVRMSQKRFQSKCPQVPDSKQRLKNCIERGKITSKCTGSHSSPEKFKRTQQLPQTRKRFNRVANCKHNRFLPPTVFSQNVRPGK